MRVSVNNHLITRDGQSVESGQLAAKLAASTPGSLRGKTLQSLTETGELVFVSLVAAFLGNLLLIKQTIPSEHGNI